MNEKSPNEADLTPSNEEGCTNEADAVKNGSSPVDMTPEPDTNEESSTDETKESEPSFRYVHSSNFPELLKQLGMTLIVSTYQAGKLVVFRETEGRVSMLLRTFDKAMGVAVDQNRIAVGTNYQVWTLRNSPQVASKMKPEGTHDACYIPRGSHVTGAIDVHELAWGQEGLWLVNTLFACLCTLEEDFSFVPRWKPPFVSRLARQDRCHLNGVAMDNGIPKYVTVFGETDEPEGWRPGKVDGGCLIDIASGETMARGFSMPHSPRVYAGKIWMLDSGKGQLVTVDEKTGKTDVVASLPGYTRGLAFCDRFAFVGLSKIRETAIFGGVPIAERPEERKCGISVVDLPTGQVVAFLEFDETVEELFDVQVLRGVKNAAVVGFNKDTIKRACVIAPERPI